MNIAVVSTFIPVLAKLLQRTLGAPITNVKSAKNFEDVGSVQIAVLSISPWAEAQTALQPSFSITAMQAFDLALPSTTEITRQTSNTSSVGATIAVPQIPSLNAPAQQAASKSAGPTSGGAAQPATNKQAENKKDSEAATPAAKTETGSPVATDSTSAAKTEPAGAAAAASLATDPMLRLLTATAIYQEAAMLNRYVVDALKFDGGIAQVVRLQVALQPKRRDLPFDVYTQISVIPDDIERHVASACRSGSSSRVEIVPLLVTDNLETILGSSSAEAKRQLGLSLLAGIKGVGISGEFSRTLDQLEQILGRDLNSVLTVSRLSHDTVTIRIGASRTTSGYAMIPRTHNLTFLVIYIPCDGLPDHKSTRTLSVIAHSEFVNAENGECLAARDEFERVTGNLQRINTKFNLSLNTNQLFELAVIAGHDDWNTYYQRLEAFTRHGQRTSASAPANAGQTEQTPASTAAAATVKSPEDLLPGDSHADLFGEYAAALWVDLIELRLGNPYSVATFEVGAHRPEPVAAVVAGQRQSSATRA